MRVIIAGSRNLHVSPHKIQEYVDRSGFDVTNLVCGKARGIDSCGEDWARRVGIPIKSFPYSMGVKEAVEKYGTSRMGGHVRNGYMADYGEGLILVWDGVSSGSASIKEQAIKKTSRFSK